MFKWYQEPLLHFLVLGILVFFLIDTYLFDDSSKNTINIKKEEIQKMADFWEKKYHLPPTQKELEALLDIYIENEILYQEALAMKLDKNDKRIKKLIIDKLKFVISEPINEMNISKDILQTFFEKKRHLFEKKRFYYISFRHIYFNPKNYLSSNISTEEKANKVYAKIKNKSFEEKDMHYTDRFYQGHFFSEIGKEEVSKIFGYSFFQKLIKLPIKQWSEPISSGYGLHIVYIEDIKTKKADFDFVQQEVKDLFIIQKSQEDYKKFYNKIKKNYKINIEPYNKPLDEN